MTSFASGITRIYASEIIDERTCHACRAVDGKEYVSFEAAREDYPGPHRTYKGCTNEKCRGTLVLVGEEAPPSQS
jgi:hypothetical protein